jgi:hypothetical protein
METTINTGFLFVNEAHLRNAVGWRERAIIASVPDKCTVTHKTGKFNHFISTR